MAGIAIPENLRPALTALAKYHFWILAAVVPIALVPLLVIGGGSLKQRIAAQRQTIESKLGQVRSVTGVQPHPNENWRTTIDADIAAIDQETNEEWRRLWHAQSSLRVWPPQLGDDFLKDVTRLPPGGKLQRTSLVRYQNMAPRLARTLPERMGVRDAMVEKGPDAAAAAVDPTAGLAPILAWNPTSQQKLYSSFVWQRVPNTTQVLLAQEELHVYGLFCDLLAGFVKGATGAHDSPLTFVDELAVGFPANGHGDRSLPAQRILIPKVAVPGAEGAPGMEGGIVDPGMMEGGGGDPQAQAIWHPRFTTAGGGGIGPPAEGAPPPDPAAGSPDDNYRGWIYVDFSDKPLSVPELAANPVMRMVHLMPFVLRVVVDQRQLDRLLLTLAQSPVPIDVRQVRVNAGYPVGQITEGKGGGFAGDGGSGMPGGPGSRRPNDLVVELRGSVALAAPPVAAAPPAETVP